MFFKNAIFFTLPLTLAQSLRQQVMGDPEPFQALLGECALKPVGPLELESRGFVSPFGEDAEALYHARGTCVWVTVGTESRILPSSVVNKELKKKLDAIEKQEGRKPGGRTRKRLKDELVTELLPKAFVKPGRIDAYIDLDRGIVVVDSASRKAAESVVSEIRRSLGSFPALPLNAETAPRAVLTGWVAGEPLPEGLTVGDECELRDPVSSGAVVRCKHQELQGDEVAKLLEAGKQVTRLAFNLADHVAFVFGEDLVLRKLKLLDGAVESLEGAEREDLHAELDARFVLLTAELGGVFDTLKTAFKFSEPND